MTSPSVECALDRLSSVVHADLRYGRHGRYHELISTALGVERVFHSDDSQLTVSCVLEACTCYKSKNGATHGVRACCMTYSYDWSALHQQVRNHILQEVAYGPAMLNVTRHASLVLTAADGPLTPGSMSDTWNLEQISCL